MNWIFYIQHSRVKNSENVILQKERTNERKKKEKEIKEKKRHWQKLFN